MTWAVEGFRKGQDELTVRYGLPGSFTRETAARWVGDWPDLIGSVFEVPPERTDEMAESLGIAAGPETDHHLPARDGG